MAAEAHRQISNPGFQKPPKKSFIFAAILAAGLCLGSAPKPSPIPENPYNSLPAALLPPNPYIVCERTNRICAPKIFITDKRELRECGPLTKEQLGSLRQLETRETLSKMKWLYEGTPVEGALSEFPPIALELSISTREQAAFSTNRGAQVQNTNLALFDFSKGSTQEEREMVLAHELAHYISWLGSGWEASYLFNGERVSTMSPIWLAQGGANWAACRTPGFSCALNPEGTGLKVYHLETYIFAFLESISGKEALRKAVVSGDFAQVQSAFDKKFGKGSFEQLMDKDSSTEALRFLAFKTSCFESPRAGSIPGDSFAADALSFLRNSSQLLMSVFCGQK